MLTQNKIGVLAHINTLLSRPVDTPLPLAQALPQPTAIKSLKFLQQKGLEDHPKIKALSAEIRSLEHKKENASLAVLPDFTVKAGYSTLMDNTDKHFTVGVALNLPLNLSKYQAIEDEATAHLKQARWKKQDQVQELAELIQLYYSQVNKYQQTLKLYQQKILPLAKQNKLAALADYQAGYGGFLILIRAEKDWHRSRLKAMQTLIDYHENLALLEYAVGVFKLSKERGL
jgi:outer membrane protein TolC